MSRNPGTLRVVLCTGAASGIGRAVALRFAQDGAESALILADVNEFGLAKTARMAEESGAARVMTRVMDVGCESDVTRLVCGAVEELGRIDVAVHAAGIEGMRGRLADYSTEVFDAVLRTNLKGTFLCMKHELAAWEAFGGQFTIVNIGSTAGSAAMAEFSGYCASKHGVNALTKCAAREYASRGVRVNAVCPSTTDTPMVARFQATWPAWQAAQNASIPAGRIATPEEVARAVAWLASNECPFMNGHCLVVDGAQSA